MVQISAAVTVLEYRFDLKGQMQYTRREPHEINLSTSQITVDLHLTSINNWYIVNVFLNNVFIVTNSIPCTTLNVNASEWGKLQNNQCKPVDFLWGSTATAKRYWEPRCRLL